MSDHLARLQNVLADRYAIEREVGAGGMATVYLAEDVKHRRKVALKVLRPELAAVIGAERFLKEIEVTAQLQHPHILPLHDSGEADTFLYYVMPYVAGESLRDRLTREKQLSVEQTIEITRAVASALDYAHRRGVVHRDIKPANILLLEDQPVVADFGIALAVRAAGGTRLTETGLSLGTPHYMSPEQAMGDREVGPRSDVYALGCVVYEMLAGEPPYTGPTAQAVVAKLITEKPQRLSLYRDTVPPHVEAAVHKALAKLPADRFATAAAFADALGRAGAAPVSPAAESSRAATVLRRLATVARRPVLAWTVAAVAIAMAILPAARRGAPTPPPRVARFAVRLPSGEELAGPYLGISREGGAILLQTRSGAQERLALRRLDGAETVPLLGTNGNRPFLSPDGDWVAFAAEGKLWKTSTAGGSRIALTDARWGGGDWGDDGMIVYTQSYQSGLWEVSAAGGEARELSHPDSTRGELAHWWPQILPRGKGVLFTAYSSPIERARIEVLSAHGERRTLVEGAIHGRYAPTGHLLFVRGGALFAARFDLDRLAVVGQPVPVVEDLAVDPTNGWGAYGLSDDGTLIYLRKSVWYAGARLVWVDRSGHETLVTDRIAPYEDPALSPDGRRLAVTIRDGTRDVWVYELGRGVFTRLTRHAAAAFKPAWTPDGARIVYEAEVPQFDLRWRTADGSGPEEELLSTPNDKVDPTVTPDGRYVVFAETDPVGDLWMLRLDGTGERQRVLETPFYEQAPAVSPDGRWLAYQSDEPGREEVYIMPFPAGGRRIQVSTSGGVAPSWARGGREVVYVSQDRMMSVAFDPATGTVGRPVELFGDATPDYDVTPDGARFVLTRVPPESRPREVAVILNWFQELQAKVPARQ